MRRDAKASSAGSIAGSGAGRGLFRRAFAIRGASTGSVGSGASALGRFGAILVAATALLATAFAPGASAAVEATPSYAPVGSFGGPAPGNSNDQFSNPAGIDLEPGSGNILVADSANSRIQVFAPTGNSATYLTSFGVGTLVTPTGIAVDQASGAVYVSDSGANQIFRFTSDGAPTPTYTRDLGFASPAQGSGAGQVGSFASPLAIDPVSHDLLLADKANKRIARFTTAGAPVPSFNGPASLSDSLTGPLDIAVAASGAIYVVDLEAGGELEFGGPSYVRVFTASGTPDGQLQGADSPSAIAVEPGGGQIMVGGDSGSEVNPRSLYVFNSAGAHLLTAKLKPDSVPPYAGLVRGIAATSGKVYVLTDLIFGFSGEVSVQVAVPALRPGLEAEDVSAIEARAAHVAGTVAAGGAATTVRFEYSLNGTDWTATPDQSFSGTGEEAVEADLSGLLPQSQYSVRLHAESPYFSITSKAISFVTAGAAPEVFGESVANLASTSAALNGKVNPNGPATTYHFEYGESTGYGQRFPAGIEDVAGAGNNSHHATGFLTGLTPSTVYHYRLVAVNAIGTTNGDDHTFTTAAAVGPCPNEAIREREHATYLPDCRAYEQVTPVEKNGAVPSGAWATPFVRDDGNAIAYPTEGLTYVQGESNPLFPKARGLRSADGWSTDVIDPPSDTTVPGASYLNGTVVVSKDLSRALVTTHAKLTPDAAGGGAANTYLREIGTDNYTLVSPGNDLSTLGGPAKFLGASDDLRTVALAGEIWREGSGLESVLANPGITARRDVHQVSTDGSRVYTERVPGSPGQGVYLHENGTTIPVSVSHLPGDPPGTVAAANFGGASPDGRFVVFYSPHVLTPDAAPNGGAYRYDVETDSLTFLTAAIGSNGGFIAALPAADILYSTDGISIFYTHAGVTRNLGSWIGGFEGGRASANGKYFIFGDSFFDAETGTISCPPCRTDGGPSLGGALIGEPEYDAIGRHAPTAVLNDGTLFFDTPNPLVPTDSNGTRDVYSYNHGKVELLSGGKQSVDSIFFDATPSGSDVFFTSNTPYVGQDKDTARDLYDVRVNGGLASQNPDPPVECLRDDCKGTPDTGPELPFGGSEGLSGPENFKPIKKRCGKGRRVLKAQGKARCVKHQKKRAKSNRRQSR